MENEKIEGIRTDLWNNMSLQQLNEQRDLILQDMNKLQTMMQNAPDYIRGMHMALQHALDAVNQLIDHQIK